jgi:hypothetical protein
MMIVKVRARYTLYDTAFHWRFFFKGTDGAEEMDVSQAHHDGDEAGELSASEVMIRPPAAEPHRLVGDG